MNDKVQHLPDLAKYLRAITPTVADLRDLGGAIVYDLEDQIETTAADHYRGFKGAGVAVTGWDLVGTEMEVTVIPFATLDEEKRAAIERCVMAWVEHATAGDPDLIAKRHCCGLDVLMSGPEVAAVELTAVLWSAPEGGYCALNPETGTTSEGESQAEALQNLQEATALFLEEFPLPLGERPVVTTFRVTAVA